MPTYVIGGKRITTQQALTDDQIDEIASDMGASAPIAEPTPRNPVSDDFIKRASTSMYRAENPVMSKVADVAGGMTGLARGGLNIVGSVFGNSKLGQDIFPTAAVDKNSWSYLAGEVADPVSMAVGSKALQLAGKVPQIARLGKAAPIAQGFVGGTGAGAATGALSESGDAGSGAVLGGLVGGGIPLVGKGVQKLAQIAEPITRVGAQTAAGRMIKDVAGDAYDPVLSALKNAQTPFSSPSVAQATAKLRNPDIAALQKLAEQKVTVPGVRRMDAQAANREGMLGSFSGTKEEIAGMWDAKKAADAVNSAKVAEKSATNRAAYEASIPRPTADVPSNLQPGMKVRQVNEVPQMPALPALDSLKRNAGFQAAIADARKSAASKIGLPESGLTETQIKDIIADPTRSFEGLKLIKAAIDDRFADPTNQSSALFNIKDRDLTQLKNKFLGIAEQLAPGWGAIRDISGEGSNAIFQKQVGKNMLGLLQKPLGQGETGAKLARAVESETALVKKAGGFGREGLDEQLTPENMAKVRNVIAQLDVDTSLEELARKGANSTALKDATGEVLQLPNLMNQAVALSNSAIRRVFHAGQVKTLRELSSIMQDPKLAAQLMEKASAKEKNALKFMENAMRYYSPYAAAQAGSTE